MAESAQQFFSDLESRIDRSKTAGMNATYQFHITGEGGGDWYVVLEDGQPQVHEGTAENPNITLTADSKHWLDVVNGKTSGQMAFLTGKLKIKGDMGLAMKLQSVLG
jgi:putative sterol carrier protein